MKKIRVSAVQMNALKENLDHNLEVHSRLTEEAASTGSRIVMFPELSTTGHFGDRHVTDFAEEFPQGRIAKFMIGLAKKYNLAISYGFCESANGTFYNSQALVTPEGAIGLQRKLHASSDEYYHFRMGATVKVYDIGYCRIGTLVCYDSMFFEPWRILAINGAEVLLLPHAARSGWAEQLREEEILEQMPGRVDRLVTRFGVFAEDNAVFAVFGNQVGYNGHSTHFGGAFILSPTGEVLVREDRILEDIIVTAELDPAVLVEKRNSSHCSLKTRRPEVYGDIVKMM